MIKLTIEQERVNNIIEIYRDNCYHYNNESQASLPAMLKTHIEPAIRRSNTSAERIVQKFLRNYFVTQNNGTDQVDELKIETYLENEKLEDVINFFWTCVAEEWLAKLNMPGAIRIDHQACIQSIDVATIAKQLCKWEGVRKYVKQHRNDYKPEDGCPTCVTEIITIHTFPFFRIPYETSFNPTQDGLEKKLNKQMFTGVLFDNMDFRYHDDVFSKETVNPGALKLLAEIFDYDLLRGTPRHKVLNELYVSACPYCNRQYITKYDFSDQTKTTADLDHYYYKEIYPYLALSIYNFVPSCQICNRLFKHTADFHATPHLYPYTQQSNSEMQFKLNKASLLWEIKQWNDPNVTDQIVIDIVPGKVTAGIAKREAAVKNSVKDLRLKEVYQTHKGYVCELMGTALAYSEKQIQQYYKDFTIEYEKHGKKNIVQLFSSEVDIEAMVYGHYLDENALQDRPLAKLTYDLLEELLPEIAQTLGKQK